ncbi:MAG: hypothetical protein IT203_10910 [Fimbriimonadaceae bacterium]|nr:hypothetical protein [Fimbriimonadaceae bacterium]
MKLPKDPQRRDSTTESKKNTNKPRASAKPGDKFGQDPIDACQIQNSDEAESQGKNGELDDPNRPDKPKLAGEVNPCEDDGKDEVEPKVVGAWKWITGEDEVRQLVIEPPTGRPR